MQNKADVIRELGLLESGRVFLINAETGEKTLLAGVTEITEEPTDEMPEVLDCSGIIQIPYDIAEKGQKLYDGIVAMLKEAEEAERLQKELASGYLEDDKTPNPVYIPKHIKHRKKGRR